MDDIDRAQQREEQDRELALAGECHWCAASVAGEAHFCDTDCRRDFERDLAARRRAGLHK